MSLVSQPAELHCSGCVFRLLDMNLNMPLWFSLGRDSCCPWLFSKSGLLEKCTPAGEVKYVQFHAHRWNEKAADWFGK